MPPMGKSVDGVHLMMDVGRFAAAGAGQGNESGVKIRGV